MTRWLALGSGLTAAALLSTPVAAQAPPEVSGVGFSDPATLAWTATPSAISYNVYRGELSGLASGIPGRCHGHPVPATSFGSPADPAEGSGFFYLVTARSATTEGTAGLSSSGVARALLGRCEQVMRQHVLDRIGYGWSEWARDRIVTLGGLPTYIDEQLAPDTISEADNTALNTRMAPLDPPENIVELIARQVVTGVYARRQLAAQVGSFWTNHFNTDWRKVADVYQGVYPQCGVQPQCDPAYPQRAYLETSRLQLREYDNFSNSGLKGRFRKILEQSALSPAMIIFLDTYANIAGMPNENYSRELLELYSMGVDGGYTQNDVEQLARVLTGWTVCKKTLAEMNDPLKPCIASYWLPTPAGEWVATFVPANHDCEQKVLFAGTPQQTTIGPTCGVPQSQVQELHQALDAIVAHPSTPRFISRKILQAFVTDDPSEAAIDALVAEWNDATNQFGVGDLGAVLRAALTSPAFLDPDAVHSKIKTPLEHFVSAFRATRGNTDGITEVINYLQRARHLPYYNPVPTGWPETGEEWLDTNNTLERQNFGIRLAALSGANFGSDPLALLTANAISTAPGNAAAIVDFLADVMFGGALTPAERQAAIDFLNTDDLGNLSPYNAARIRDTVGFLLGYGQFQEQ